MRAIKGSQSGRSPILIYSAFPRSASQYLANLIMSSTGDISEIVNSKICSGYGHNFMSFDKIQKRMKNGSKNALIYGHIPFNKSNNFVIKHIGINSRIIISIRSLPDVVISYKEHVDRTGRGPLDYGINELQECNPFWKNLDDKGKYDYIIDFVIPWYVRFVISWSKGASREPSNVLNFKFVTYEEYTQYPYDFMRNISEFLGVSCVDGLQEKLEVKDFEKINFNKGLVGRGRKILDKEQLRRIKNLLSYFGDEFIGSNLGLYLLFGYEGLSCEATVTGKELFSL